MISIKKEQRDNEIVWLLDQKPFFGRDQIQRFAFPCQKQEHEFFCDCPNRTKTSVQRTLQRLVKSKRISIYNSDARLGIGRLFTARRPGRRKEPENLAHYMLETDAFVWLATPQDYQIGSHSTGYFEDGPYPDSLIEANNSLLFVEADTGSERGHHLLEKFLKYKKRMERSYRHYVLFVTYRRNLKQIMGLASSVGLHQILFCSWEQSKRHHPYESKIWHANFSGHISIRERLQWPAQNNNEAESAEENYAEDYAEEPAENAYEYENAENHAESEEDYGEEYAENSEDYSEDYAAGECEDSCCSDEEDSRRSW